MSDCQRCGAPAVSVWSDDRSAAYKCPECERVWVGRPEGRPHVKRG
jgi:predicted RNA-binding Zn-ribbon protein involved in translation (DUF1610 family)